MANYSDYIVYVDESGTHSITDIDKQYPVFSLAFCIFQKQEYIKTIGPALDELKLKYWGHADVVLHDNDIRKNIYGDWSILNTRENRYALIQDIYDFISNMPFHVIYSVINKQELSGYYKRPFNPYNLAMLFCMERLNKWLIDNGQQNKIIPVHFEARGKKEDKELEQEFKSICDNSATTMYSQVDFSRIDYRFRAISKKSNSTGLQIADMLVRPVGINAIRPHQPNRALDIIKTKLIRGKTFP